MKLDRQEVRAMIYAAIDELNEQLPSDERLEKSAETKLFGESGSLDSLGLINLIVLAEDAIERATGRTVSLSEYTDAERSENPFETVDTFAEAIQRDLADL